MRKALLVFALVAFLATGTVFAELTGVGEPTVSGSVSTTYGYDLDSEAHGFYNDSSLTLTLPLLDGDMTKGGDDGMYGEITVDGIGWQLNNDGFYDVDEDADATNTGELDASISAKLVLNSLYVDLGAPSFSINNVDVSDDYYVDANFWADDEPDFQGIAVGFMNDMVTVEARIANRNDGFYDDTDDDIVVTDDEHTTGFDNDLDDDADDDYTANKAGYVVGAMLSITPAEGITIPVSFGMDLNAADTYMGIGAAPSIAMGMLTVDVPVDYVMIGEQYGFEVGPSISYCLTEKGGSNVAVNFVYGMYEETVATSGAPAPYPVVENAVADLGVTFTETAEKGFVPGLAAMLDVAFVDFMDHLGSEEDILPLSIDAEASYDMDGLKPYMSTGYAFKTAELDLGVGLELAAGFTGLDNTTITLDYTNDVLVNGETDYSIDDTETENGRVTFDVTVSF